MTISTRVREESGFGLVELLIAMTVMVVGITALVAGMSSGMVALQRAAKSSTAAAVADIQMEGVPEVEVRIDPTRPARLRPPAVPTDCFTTQHGHWAATAAATASSTTIRWNCAVGTLDGAPTRRPYARRRRLGAARPAKRVTIVVHDPSTTPAKELFRETSTFDQATG